MNMKCKCVAAMTGPNSLYALLLIYINSPFLNLGKTVIPLLKKAPFQMPLLQKQLVSSLEEPDEINENTSINVQPLPSQDRWKTITAEIFRKYLKEVKDLSYFVENLGEALGYLTNIRRIFQGTAPNESCISLEPTKVGSRWKIFSSFALPLRKKRDKYWAACKGSSII